MQWRRPIVVGTSDRVGDTQGPYHVGGRIVATGRVQDGVPRRSVNHIDFVLILQQGETFHDFLPLLIPDVTH